MKFTVLSALVLGLSASVYTQSVQSGVCLATCGSNDYICKAKCVGVPIPANVSPAIQTCLRGCTSTDASTINCLKNCVSGNGATTQPSSSTNTNNNNNNPQSNVGTSPTAATPAPATTQAHSAANAMSIGTTPLAVVVLTVWSMVSLSSQKRLAASVLKCGKRKVWIDPNEISEIANANSRQNIRKLVKDGLIIKKPNVVHSRFRVREKLAAKRKGRHTGTGKRRGTAEARMPTQVLWPQLSYINRYTTIQKHKSIFFKLSPFSNVSMLDS
ncbi:60S ribosomal protein L19B [Basidiobolus ranarum]|uniref:Ribosomal protein L19 n=1 Tax=Basidiobolus ranarum TaxID=34480 RepID=A0ABR2VXC2_9FUNG